MHKQRSNGNNENIRNYKIFAKKKEKYEPQQHLEERHQKTQLQ
jgi:hypothetical protein